MKPAKGFVFLKSLKPGTAFRTESGSRGVLIYANESRARVSWGTKTTRTAVAHEGTADEKTFTIEGGVREIDIAANTEVIPTEANDAAGQ